nr:Gag-Pol polyprotein [Tanacetum cinerariifolium]
MCMFAFNVSTAESKNIKEAMDDHVWINEMQEELHQFDKLNVWELIDKPFGKTVINIKWLWKNKKDEDDTVIRSRSNLGNTKWYQSLLRSFDKKNDTQTSSFFSKSQTIQKMVKSSSSSKNEEVRDLIRTRKVLDTVLFPPPAQVYSPSKKDMSWTGLPEFADDTITDYSRNSPSIESNSSDLQNSNYSVSEYGESSKSIMSKPMIKFVKAADSPTVIKSNKTETVRKPPVKYDEMYRNTTKSLKVRGNQRNWNNLMNQRLASNFEFKNKDCSECGSFNHLIKDCYVHQKQEKGKNWSKNNFAHKNVTPRADLFKTASVSATRRVNTVSPRPNVNSARPKTTQDLMIIKLIQRVKRDTIGRFSKWIQSWEQQEVLVVLEIRSTTLNDKVIFTLSSLKKWQLSIGNSFALTVEKCTRSGNSAVGMLLH